MTGGRLGRLREHLGERFLLTYGDGLSDVPIDEVIKHHEQTGSLATITAVHPPPRFGALEVVDGKVSHFREKPREAHDLINGGYFVAEPEILDLVDDDATVFESRVLGTLAERGQLGAYEHEGFWMPMDTVRERDELNQHLGFRDRTVGRGALVTGSDAPLNDRGIASAEAAGARAWCRCSTWATSRSPTSCCLAADTRRGFPLHLTRARPAGWARSASTSCPSGSSATTATCRR